MCKEYGNHHTDRHGDYFPKVFEDLPPQDALDVIRDHKIEYGVRDGNVHCECGWINTVQSHNEHVAQMLYDAGFVHKNQIADMINKVMTDKKAKHSDAFYDGLLAALALVKGVK